MVANSKNVVGIIFTELKVPYCSHATIITKINTLLKFCFFMGMCTDAMQANSHVCMYLCSDA